MGLKVREAVEKGTRLVVIDPRRTEVSSLAEAQEGGIWLRLRPGTNIPLLNGILRVIFEEGLANEEFIRERTEGVDAIKTHVMDYELSQVEEITGVPEDRIRDAARAYANAGTALILYGLGVAEHKGGTAGVMALANLVLATGHVGRPHTGINPLRGQNNVQGACDMGTLPYSLPGYQHTDDEKALKRFARLWNVPELPVDPGLMEPQMYDEALRGNFRGLYVVGYDPAQTQGNVSHVRAALKALDFLVVQDLFLTETARYAHVVLPAACFYEKDGTFTSGERRIRRVHKAVDPPWDARPDWEIVCLISQAMGYPMFYTHPSQIMAELSQVTPPYAGVSYERIEGHGQVWPCPAPDHPGTALLHTERFPIGKGRFVPVSPVFAEEDADRDFPLTLVTGRRLEHYNNASMTRRCEAFDRIAGKEFVEIHPEDAADLGIVDGSSVAVESRRGRVIATARVTERSRPGSVFMTFHFSETPVNILTSPGLDTKTLTPEYKVCAVRVLPDDDSI